MEADNGKKRKLPEKAEDEIDGELIFDKLQEEREMGADKGKKPKLPEKAEDGIDGELIEKLQEIQDELENVTDEAMRKPIYHKRNDIIKSIPKFWTTVFTKHSLMSEYLCEEDHPIFEHLASVEVEDFQDVKSGYSISFIFDDNTYFEDKKLTQTIKFIDGTTKITGTTITWKDGKGIPNGAASWENKGKRSDKEQSFFNFFGENEVVEDFQIEVAETIKLEVWPNPLPYFNEARERSDDDDDDGDWLDIFFRPDLTMLLKREMVNKLIPMM